MNPSLVPPSRVVKPYFLDTEFNEETDPQHKQLISIGLVDLTGREFYGVAREFNQNAASPWITKHVVPHLPPFSARLGRTQMAGRLRDYFIESIAQTPSPRPNVAEFWGRNHASDSSNLWAIFGTQLEFKAVMARLGIDQVDFREIKELTRHFPKEAQPKQPKGTHHHSLHDARHKREVWKVLSPRVKTLLDLGK